MLNLGKSKNIKNLKVLLVVAFVFTLFLTSPAYGVLHAQKFKNCAAVIKIYEGGVAKNKRVTNKNSKGAPQESRYVPFVSKKIYNLNKGLDRDKDGIACER